MSAAATDRGEATDTQAILARLDALDAKLDALARLSDTLDRLGPDGLRKLESAIGALGTFAERLPVIADAAGTSVDWVMDQAARKGVDPLAAGVDAGELLLDAAAPENLALVKRLLAQRAALSEAVSAVEAIDPEDLRTLTAHSAQLTRSLAAALRTPEFGKLIEAGTSAATLSTAEAAAGALVAVRKEPTESVGLFAAIRRMGDPDVQRAVGFTLGLAKRFGQWLAR